MVGEVVRRSDISALSLLAELLVDEQPTRPECSGHNQLPASTEWLNPATLEIVTSQLGDLISHLHDLSAQVVPTVPVFVDPSRVLVDPGLMVLDQQLAAVTALHHSMVFREVQEVFASLNEPSLSSVASTADYLRWAVARGTQALTVAVITGRWFVIRCDNCGRFVIRFDRRGMSGKRIGHRFCPGSRCNSSFWANKRDPARAQRMKARQRHLRREMMTGKERRIDAE